MKCPHCGQTLVRRNRRLVCAMNQPYYGCGYIKPEGVIIKLKIKN